MSKITLIITLLFSCSLFAQSSKQPPCSGPEYEMMDFWVGDWALTWGSGKSGINIVNKVMDGCAVEENFSGSPGIPGFEGKSIS
ncbi:MAG: hypothetical protein ACPF8V_07595, partial [Luteibaculum sp.]